MDLSRSEANSGSVFGGASLRDLENHFPEVFSLAQ
jgi:hypothetical protein